MQMDMNFTTVPMFAGETRRLYWETKLSSKISDQNIPKNYPLYSTDEDMGFYILSLNEAYEEEDFKPPIT